jgi:hypothetical protein
MDDRSRDASALLGMEGFVVLSQTEEDGECWVLVETTRDVAVPHAAIGTPWRPPYS